MSDSGVGFGGFLLGVGGGYYLFRYVNFNADIISYLLILMGLGIILGSLLFKGRKNPIQDVFGGFIGGLILAAFITQGFGFVDNFTDQWDDIGDMTYRATKDIPLTAPIDAGTVSLSVDSVNGAVEVSPWSGDEVKIDLEVKAKGSSTADAEENLDDFVYDLSSDVSGGEQEIALTFPMPSINFWNTYSVFIQVYVPEGEMDMIFIDTTNGAITIDDLEISELDLDTTNGAIRFSGVQTSTISAHTTNGGVFGTISSEVGSFSTTNGAIEIILDEQSGSYNFDTTNGSIDINLPSGSDIGYDINLDTSIGSIDVNLPNIDYSVDRSREKVGETVGYDSKTVQIEIDADTTIGGIDLN
jgi:DUF4097 and DUF4098 domain-containing protein YvlB